jgi:NitT/TauT family transport system ATP-binding protein
MLELKGISKTYESRDLKAVEQISFRIRPSEIVMLTGPSGCGKTTLLNIISGNMDEYEGRVEGRYERIGYVFQEDRLLEWKTVLENIRLVAPEKSESHALKLTREVGLEGFEHYYPADLSGGMRHRCAIARALYYGSDILLMDEPFKSLDRKLRQEMLKLVHKIRRFEKTAVLFVTHDIEEALKLGDRVLILTKRPSRIAEELVLDEDFEKRDPDSPVYRELKEIIIKQLEN